MGKPAFAQATVGKPAFAQAMVGKPAFAKTTVGNKSLHFLFDLPSLNQRVSKPLINTELFLGVTLRNPFYNEGR